MDTLGLKTRGVISIIGAGGKTSLMFRLARELADSGRTVLTTTTTKIFMPEKEDSPYILIADAMDDLIENSRSCLDRYPHFSAACAHESASGKLHGFPGTVIDQLWQAALFDWIIVEADGARRKPLKSTDSHEPVIPSATTHLILVAGLDAVGEVLDDHHVHRAGLFSRNSGLPMGRIMDEKAIARSIAVEIKKAQGFSRAGSTSVFLNKADTQARIRSGQKIARYLMATPSIDNMITASLRKGSFITSGFDGRDTGKGDKGS